MSWKDFVEDRKAAAQLRQCAETEEKNESLKAIVSAAMDTRHDGISINSLLTDRDKYIPQLTDLQNDAAMLRLRNLLLIRPAKEIFEYEIGFRTKYMQGNSKRRQKQMLAELEETLDGAITSIFTHAFDFFGGYAREVISGQTKIYDHKLLKSAYEFPFGRYAEMLNYPEFTRELAQKITATVKNELDKERVASKSGWGGLSAAADFHSM